MDLYTLCVEQTETKLSHTNAKMTSLKCGGYMCYLAPPEDVRHTSLGNADPQVTGRLQHIHQDTISNISVHHTLSSS